MIKTTIFSICIFLLTAPSFAQQVVDGCSIEAYTGCPEVNLSNANLEGVSFGFGPGIFMGDSYRNSTPVDRFQGSALQALFDIFQPREAHAQAAPPPCEYSLWEAYNMCQASCDGWYDVGKERESCKFGCMWMWQNVRNGNNPSNCHFRD